MRHRAASGREIPENEIYVRPDADGQHLAESDELIRFTGDILLRPNRSTGATSSETR
jgi:hypothetical protein